MVGAVNQRGVSSKDWLFLACLLAIQACVIYGKSLVAVMFAQGVFSDYPDPSPLVLGLALFNAFWFLGLKISHFASDQKLSLAGALSISTLCVEIVVTHSVVVSILTMICYIYATAVIIFDDYVDREMDIEFWQLALKLSVQAVQVSVVIFGIGMALLRYFSNGIGENNSDFLTTFFYATFCFAATMFLFINWVLLPCWLRLVDGHTLAPIVKRPLGLRARQLRRYRKR